MLTFFIDDIVIDHSTSVDDGGYPSDAEEKLAKLEAELKKITDEKAAIEMENKMLKGRIGKIFNEDQMKAVVRDNVRGFSWDISTIKKALQVRFACGTNGYNLLLKQHHPLPSVRTLQRRMSEINFGSGILHQVFSALHTKGEYMCREEKICCLTLDEMCLTACTEYDASLGQIVGGATLPDHEGQATHGLVFMLGGLSSRWKQVIAYYLTSNKTDGSVLRPIVLEITEIAAGIGFHICAVASDMGSANRAMWTTFGLATNRHFNITKIVHPQDEHKYLHFLPMFPTS